MGWTATYFTTIIIEGNTPQTGIFFYSGTPGLGGLIGSWTAQAGTDAYGNSYPAGINVTAGSLQGVNISNSTLASDVITSALMSASSISSSAFNGGAVNESVITFNASGGGLWLYSTTTNTTTYNTAGISQYPAPAASVGALNVMVWGGDAGGGGGSTSEGGEGGGGAEFAQEPSYSNYNPGGTYQVSVGAGGKGGNTFNGGTAGQQSNFDNTGVVAGGGGAGANFIGGVGGAISNNTVHYPGGNGGNPSGFTASAGGGGRAGSTGPGGNGGNATGNSSPGFGGTAGSGTGGKVGSNGVDAGNNGNSGNAGGSGAGEAGSGTTYQNIHYDPTSTASYYGAGVGGGLRNTNGSLFQGDPDVPVTTFPGDQESFANYNYTKIRSDWSGWTIDQTTITINNQHSWYNNGCYCVLGWAASSGNNYNTNQFWCDQGATTGPVDISNYNGVIASQFEAFIFGPSSSTSGGSLDLYNYGYFQGGAGQGGPRITINGHKGTGGIQTAGNGSAGAVIISYQSSSVLVGGASAITQTDAAGNALAVGWTGPVQAITPGSSPATVETWHTLTVPTTGTNCTAVSGTARYKLMAEHNAVWLDVQLALTSTGDFTIVMSTTLPATGYRPTSTRRPPGATSGTLTSDNSSRLYVDTTGSVQAIGPNGGTSFTFSGMLPLD